MNEIHKYEIFGILYLSFLDLKIPVRTTTTAYSEEEAREKISKEKISVRKIKDLGELTKKHFSPR